MDSVKNDLANTLIIDEGVRYKPYKCTAGRMTIGVGRNFQDNPFSEGEREMLGIKSTKPETQYEELTMKPLSKEQVFWLLNHDIDKLLLTISKHEVLGPIYKKQDDLRKVAMANLLYNMGLRTLLTFKNFLAAMNREDYKAAAQSLKNSKWYYQVKSRAKRICHLVEHGELRGY